MREAMDLRVVGRVRSPLREPDAAPMQGSEGAPDAVVEIDARLAGALDGLAAGDALILPAARWGASPHIQVTWLHEADREVLRVHPRDDPAAPLAGVFATRSPDRPNPLGLHPVTLRAIEGTTLVVGPLEAIDGTPVVDVKPDLRPR